jgi:hypothetical protein
MSPHLAPQLAFPEFDCISTAASTQVDIGRNRLDDSKASEFLVGEEHGRQLA